MRQGFPISIFTRVRAHIEDAICIVQLNNLIIHMQIRKWGTKNKKQRKQKLRFWRSVHQTSSRTVFCSRALCSQHIKSSGFVATVGAKAHRKESMSACPLRASNCTREIQQTKLVIYEVCCEYGCQISSVLRIFFNKFVNFVRSLYKNVVSNSNFHIFFLECYRFTWFGKNKK